MADAKCPKSKIRESMRKFFGMIFSVLAFVVTVGRLQGGPFIIRRPSLIRIRGRAYVGRNVMIEQGARVVVSRSANLWIGDDVYIGKNSTLVAYSDLRIGSRTLVGENVSIHTEDHGPPSRRGEFAHSPVVIEEDVWLGAGVVVLRGSSVGAGSTVGANAVVNSVIPSGVLAVGIPAKVRRKVV